MMWMMGAADCQGLRLYNWFMRYSTVYILYVYHTAYTYTSILYSCIHTTGLIIAYECTAYFTLPLTI